MSSPEPSPASSPGRNELRALWDRWAGTVQCAVTAVLALLGLVWIAHASQKTRLGQQVDEAARTSVVGDERTTRHLVGILGNVSLGTVVLAVVVLVGLALLRRRYVAAAAAFTLVAGANVTTQLIKRLYDRVDFQMLTVNSLPSGHASVVCSLALAALLVAPEQLRPTATLLGSMAVTVVAAATMVAGWHRPADIAAALLVCLTWGALVLVAWSLLVGGSGRPGQQPHGVLALVGVVLASALLLGVGVRPSNGWAGVLDAGVVLSALGLASASVVRGYAVLSTGPVTEAATPRFAQRRREAGNTPPVQ